MSQTSCEHEPQAPQSPGHVVQSSPPPASQNASPQTGPHGPQSAAHVVQSSPAARSQLASPQTGPPLLDELTTVLLTLLLALLLALLELWALELLELLAPPAPPAPLLLVLPVQTAPPSPPAPPAPPLPDETLAEFDVLEVPLPSEPLDRPPSPSKSTVPWAHPEATAVPATPKARST